MSQATDLEVGSRSPARATVWGPTTWGLQSGSIEYPGLRLSTIGAQTPVLYKRYRGSLNVDAVWGILLPRRVWAMAYRPQELMHYGPWVSRKALALSPLGCLHLPRLHHQPHLDQATVHATQHEVIAAWHRHERPLWQNRSCQPIRIKWKRENLAFDVAHHTQTTCI